MQNKLAPQALALAIILLSGTTMLAQMPGYPTSPSPNPNGYGQPRYSQHGVDMTPYTMAQQAAMMPAGWSGNMVLADGSQVPPHAYGPEGYCPDGSCGGAGGVAAVGLDCGCPPRWFDLHLEGVYLKRDEDSLRTVNYVSSGVGPGTIALSSDNFDFTYEPGFRATVTFAGSPWEIAYLGTLNYAAGAQVTDTDNLYSAMSDFGTDPASPINRLDQVDSSYIEYSSNFDSVEINNRLHWASAGNKWQGSTLWGVRYVRIDEDFNHFLDSGVDGNLFTFTCTENDLVGFQLGGDLSLCLVPGATLVIDGKAGVFGNYARVKTTTRANVVLPDLREEGGNESIAVVAEGNAFLTYQVTQHFRVRSGVSVLFANGLALAAENFNSGNPLAGRNQVDNDSGRILLYGFTAGGEFVW